MNEHRLRRKSKKIQGRGLLRKIEEDKFEEDKVYDKLKEILSMKKKHGGGLKFI